MHLFIYLLFILLIIFFPSFSSVRVVFGPEMVMLAPDEQFTVLSLSGDKPKRPNVIKAVCLLLGPDFCTDIITIETADHARLQLQLSYNWYTPSVSGSHLRDGRKRLPLSLFAQHPPTSLRKAALCIVRTAASMGYCLGLLTISLCAVLLHRVARVHLHG